VLGELLDKLGSFFSKTFVVGSIPLAAFLFLNGLMAYRVSYRFQTWTHWYASAPAATDALVSFALFLAVAILSYVFSIFSVSLREILEGKYFPQLLSHPLTQRYREAAGEVAKELREARRNRREIHRNQQIWTTRMGQAYGHGKTLGGNTYQSSQKLIQLFERKAGNQHITAQELQTEVDAITTALQSSNPERPPTTLWRDYTALFQLITYARDKWDRQYADYLLRYKLEFAGTVDEIAPTRMGNIANAAVSSYAESLYSMNFELFWPRLQKIVQGDSNFYSVLQDAKLQLDFLVALVWLTFAFTLIWDVLLPWLGEARRFFLGIASVGPILTYIWYRLAIQNYRPYCDLLGACIDLYRLDLLKALHIPLPANAEQEREIWETLGARVGYDVHSNLVLQNPS
jgi:hypothetical protein